MCYINEPNLNGSATGYYHTAVTERIVLWEVPAVVALLACSVAMVSMVTSLTRQACYRMRYEPLADDNQFFKAIKQLLPLAAFPILFLIFMIPALIFNIYSFISVPQMAITITAFISTSLWSMTSGLTLIVHIVVARCALKRKRYLVVHRAQYSKALTVF